MGDWLSQAENLAETIGWTSGTPAGVTLTAGGSNNTKGSWVELSSAAPFDVEAILIHPYNTSNYDWFSLDIGIGAAASEIVLIPDICMYIQSNYEDSSGLKSFWPVKIPSGTRISARIQCATASYTMELYCIIFGKGGQVAFTKFETLGYSSGTTQGTSLAIGGTWTSIGTTTFPYKGLIISNMNWDTATVPDFYTFDIGIGTASSEVVLIPQVPFFIDATIDRPLPIFSDMFLVNIPEGTHISVRALDTSSFDYCCIHGFG